LIDDLDDVNLISEALIKIGIDKVHSVCSAKEAFKYLEDIHQYCSPKVIVVDFYLSGMTAVEFLSTLKDMDKYKHVKVVVLSSTKSLNQIEEVKKRGL
jgi:CheY-like chemotaxis protein